MTHCSNVAHHAVFAEDVSNRGAKKFWVLTHRNLWEKAFCHVLSSPRHFYEVVMGDSPSFFAVDIDISNPTINKEVGIAKLPIDMHACRQYHDVFWHDEEDSV